MARTGDKYVNSVNYTNPTRAHAGRKEDCKHGNAMLAWPLARIIAEYNN